MKIIDSHAHLEFPQFDEDRDAMLERTRAAGVETLLAIGSGTGPERLNAAIPFAEQHDWIYATVGIHPHEAKLATEEHFEKLDELAKHPRVIAWGEMGLDYYYDHSPRDVQQQVFRRQLGQARAAKLPIVIHCRDAWADCLEMIDEDWRSSGLGGILHCFTGTLEDAKRGLDMGFMVSFAGNVTYKKMQNLRDVAKAIPLERLLTETDSPFLPPEGKRGKRNEPANVVEVARALGNVRDLPSEEIAAVTAANFRRFFRLERAESSGAQRVKFEDELRRPDREGNFRAGSRRSRAGGAGRLPGRTLRRSSRCAKISSYLREGGGKRLRPALLLLAAGASGYRGPSAIRLGAVVELIHNATLIHDDVIDGANTRRGRPSANARWGNHMSVLAGDWLYMQSFEMALRERNFAILDILIDLTQNMVEGELLQLTRLGQIDLTETEATELAYRKTACLFSGCSRLGAILGGQPKSVEDALG